MAVFYVYINQIQLYIKIQFMGFLFFSTSYLILYSQIKFAAILEPVVFSVIHLSKPVSSIICTRPDNNFNIVVYYFLLSEKIISLNLRYTWYVVRIIELLKYDRFSIMLKDLLSSKYKIFFIIKVNYHSNEWGLDSKLWWS